MSSTTIQLGIVLLLAHLVSDFLLQPVSLLKKKKRITGLALHSLINGVVTYLFLADWSGWLVPVIITASHFLIDFGKQRLKRRSTLVFLADQFLHLLVLALMIALILVPRGIAPRWFSILPPGADRAAAYLVAVILLIPAGGILVGLFVQPFQRQIKEHYLKLKETPVEGLDNGGKVIGWLERALIFVFIMTSQFAGIGFLVAAKSVFRFGEFKESKNRKEAEYIIIGTFASFLYAILVSLLLKWALGKL